MQSEQKKSLIYGLIGGAAVLGLAGLYLYLNKSSSQQKEAAIDVASLDEDDKKLMEKIRQIGEPQFESSGELEFDYLLKFCEAVAKHAKYLQEKRKSEFVTLRREALEKNDEEAYKAQVKKLLDLEQEITDKTLDIGAKAIGMEGNDIEETIQMHTEDQMKAYRMMNLQQSISQSPVEDGPPIRLVSKEDAMKAFVVQQEEQMKQMDSMMERQKEMQAMMQRGGGDPMEKQKEMMFIIMVEQCKSTDKMWKQTGVDQEELENAIQKLNLQADPEFKKVMNEYMQKIQMKAMQAQMGMGGGMGGMPF